MIYYHGSSKKIEKFDKTFQKSGFYPGIYLTSDKEKASSFGSYLYLVIAKGNYFKIESPLHEEKLINESGHSGSGSFLARKLAEKGFDGILRGNELVVFEPENLELNYLPSLSEISSLKTKMVELAQKEYDNWNQNEEGYDEILGNGGICHLISDSFCNLFSSNGFLSTEMSFDHINHVATVVFLKEGVYLVDIPFETYETGNWYNFKKKPGVLFSSDDIQIFLISSNYLEYMNS